MTTENSLICCACGKTFDTTTGLIVEKTKDVVFESVESRSREFCKTCRAEIEQWGTTTPAEKT